MYMQTNLPIIVITGPTASGKTTLAIKLAKKINAEIICADSRIVYKDLDIVSAKPTEIEKDGIVHHLIDIKLPNDGMYSAGDFTRDAKKILNNSKKPIIIQGGTWFYIKSLLDNKDLFEFGINQQLRNELSKKDNDELFEILKKKDEKRASLIHKNNRDKIIRSIELIEAIGSKLTETKQPKNKDYNAVWFMKNYEREELYKRINLRVDLMIKNGLFEEYENNKKKYGKIDVLYNTIGYKEFFDFEENIYKDFEETADKIKQHTRNFAKRQLTWFRQNKETFKINFVENEDDILKLINL